MESETGVIDESTEENLIFRDQLFVPVLKNLIKKSGGVRVFCDKYKLPLAVISLVVNGRRDVSKELVDKIYSVSVLRQHFTGEILPITSSPIFLRQIKQSSSAGGAHTEFDLKAQRLLDESNELLSKLRAKDLQATSGAVSNTSKNKKVEQLLEQHRRKVAREEAVLFRAIKAAEQKEEKKQMRAHSKTLAQIIIKKTHSGELTSDDLIAISNILNKTT
jgi:hypothetical protein